MKPFSPSTELLYRLVLPQTPLGALVIAHWAGDSVPDLSASGASHLVRCALRFSNEPETEDPDPRYAQTLTSSPLSLPFAKQSADCVILHGIFDGRTPPSYQKNHDPRQAMLSGFREILTDDGLLILPARNKWRLNARRQGGKGRGGSKSYFGYARMIKQAGLSVRDAYSVTPSCEYPIHVINSRYHAARHFFLSEAHAKFDAPVNNFLKMVLAVCGISPYLQDSFLFVCRR